MSMLKLKTLVGSACLLFFLGGCIQDEASNVEAAIDGCTGRNIQSLTIDHLNKEIEGYVLDGTDLSEQELVFSLPVGATVAPAEAEANDRPSESIYDFSRVNVRRFVVTAEDGTTQAVYQVRLNKLALPTEYSFENLRQTSPYHIMYLAGENDIMQWASGNAGFELTGMGFSPEDYPTVQIAEGYKGQAVKLETRDTGSFGAAVGMHIAAGNMFVGAFNVSNALQAPLEATRFGFPFTKMPVKLTGWYKYKCGEQLTGVDGNPVPGGRDKGDFYAVLYQVDSTDETLDGDLFPSGNPALANPPYDIDPRIVLMARIDNTVETDEWTWFELDFEPQNGKTVDRALLETGSYKLAVVFTSSISGAYFQGAVGSTLWVDEVNIVCE